MRKTDARIDDIDARILRALSADPRATVVGLAETTGLARNTVHARLAKLETEGALRSFERRIDPAALGFPLTCYIMVVVTQRKLAGIADALADVPEVLEVHGLSGVTDLLVHIVARDMVALDQLLRKEISRLPGVRRTVTAMATREIKGDARLSEAVRFTGA